MTNPNITRSDGTTALMEACVFGHAEIVRLLVENGADIRAKDQFGFTPLKIAQKNKNHEITQFIRGQGAVE